MKKNGKVLSSICIAALTVFSFAACNNSSSTGNSVGNNGGEQKFDKTTIYDIYDEDRPERDFDYESTYVRPDPPLAETRYDPEDDPAYASGKATTVTRMEAENAEINLVNNSTTTWKNVYSDVNNMAFDFRLSGKMATRNLNTPGSTLAFRFNSDKSYTVKMSLCVSVWDETHTPFVVSDYFAVRSEGIMNDTHVYSYADTTDMSIAWEDTTEMVSGGQVDSQYFHFAVIELDVAIYNGETALIIEYTGKGGANIDYLELDTSANISGFDSTHYTDGDVAKPDNGSEWYVSKFPTDDTDGILAVRKYIDGAYRTYSYGLPKYKTDGNLTEGYTAKTVAGGKTEYSFTFKNGTYSFVDDPDRMTTITLNESDVTFVGGGKTLQKKPGDTINFSDFASVEGGRNIELINIVDKNGIVIESAAPGALTVPMEDAAIEVVVSPSSGYTWLSIGSGKSTGFNTDGLDSSSFTGNTSLTFDTVVHGEKFAEKGIDIAVSGKIREGSGLRFDTKYTVASGSYEFCYNFENKGESSIFLRGYQISASAEYKADLEMTSSERYAMVIELNKGEKITLKAQYNVGTNTNFLTYFVADKDMEGMNLGMSMSVKSLGSAELIHPYAPECVRGECLHNIDPNARYTVTLKEGCGVTFENGETTAELAAGDVLPEVVNNTGKTIAGWYSTDEEKMWANNEFTMPVSPVEIAPYFAPETGTALIACSGKTNSTVDKNYKPDYFDNLNATAEDKATDEYIAKYDIASIGLRNTIINGERGIELSFTQTFVADDYLRFLTAVGTNGVQAGHNYRFRILFENRGMQTISFEVIQVQGGVKITAEEGAVSAGIVTIPAGESREVFIEITIANNNSNVMTVIVMQGETEGMVLGVAMSKEDDIVLNPDTKYTLTLSGGVTFENGETTAQLAEGEKIPAVISNVTGREIVGWYSDTTTYTTDFLMPASDTTIAPVFSVMEGYKALVPGSEQSSGKPQMQGSALVQANFNKAADSPAVIAGGEDGYAENGYILTYSGNMDADEHFRLGSVVDSSNAVLTIGANHQFAYNFENKGTADIHLRMYQINTGTNLDDGIYVDIDLKPGESMSVVLTANFATGSDNKNALSYFVVTQDMAEGMSLGISMSVKLAQ